MNVKVRPLLIIILGWTLYGLSMFLPLSKGNTGTPAWEDLLFAAPLMIATALAGFPISIIGIVLMLTNIIILISPIAFFAPLIRLGRGVAGAALIATIVNGLLFVIIWRPENSAFLGPNMLKISLGLGACVWLLSFLLVTAGLCLRLPEPERVEG